MAGPNVVSGTVPNGSTSSTVVGYFQTDAATDVSQPVEFNLSNSGTGWATSVNTPEGGTVEWASSAAGQGPTQFAVRWVIPATAELLTVWVRAINTGGERGAAYPVTLRSFVAAAPDGAAASYPFGTRMTAGADGGWALTVPLAAATDTVDGVTFTSVSSTAYAVLTYNAAGAVLAAWSVTFNTAQNADPYKNIRVAVDPATGDVIVATKRSSTTGSGSGTATIRTPAGTTITTLTHATSGFAVARLAADGTTVAWSKTGTYADNDGGFHEQAVMRVESGRLWLPARSMTAYAGTAINSAGGTHRTGTIVADAETGAFLDAVYVQPSSGTQNFRANFTDMAGDSAVGVAQRGSGVSLKSHQNGTLATLSGAGSTLLQLAVDGSGGVTLVGSLATANSVTWCTVAVAPDLAHIWVFVWMFAPYTYPVTGGLTSGSSGGSAIQSFLIQYAAGFAGGTGTLLGQTSGGTGSAAFDLHPAVRTGDGQAALVVRSTGTDRVWEAPGGASFALASNDSNTASTLVMLDATGAPQSVSTIDRYGPLGNDETTELVPGGPLGGGVVRTAHSSGSTGALTVFDPADFVADGAGAIDTSTDVSTVVTFDAVGVFGLIAAEGDTEPPPSGPDGYTALPDLPTADWPATANEDQTISVIVSSRNPDDPDNIGDYPGPFTPPTLTGSTAPTAWPTVTATPLDGGAYLDWTAVIGASGYRVYVNGVLRAFVIGQTDYTVEPLTNGTEYTVQVAAYTVAGEGPLSGAVTVTPSDTETAAPDTTWDTFGFQFWDEATGTWKDTPLVGGIPTPARIDIAGKGYLTLVQHDPTLHDDPEAPGYVPPYACLVTFTPDEDWYGDSIGSTNDLVLYIRAVATTAAGAVLATSGTLFATDYLPVYDPPTTPEGEMPEVAEGGSPSGVWTTTDKDGTGETFTWQLSPDHDGDPKGDTSSTSVTVLDTDTGDPIGTMSLSTSTGLTTTITFTATDANWYGSGQAYVRVGDGGVPLEHDGWSAWATVSFTITPVDDPPTAPTPSSMPTMAEDDGYVEQTFSTTDPDWDSESPTPMGWQLSPDMALIRDDLIQVYVSGEFAATVEIVGEAPPADENLTVTVRLTPAGDWYGSGSFYLRAVDQAGAEDLFSPWTLVSFTVTPVADAPSALYPVTMPTAEDDAAPVVGTFTVTDPDSDTVAYTVSDTPGGTFGNSVTLANGVEIDVVTPGQGSFSQQIRATFPAGFAGRYELWARATDDGGLTGPATRIRGYVAPGDLIVELTMLDRDSGSTTIRSLGPLTHTGLEIDEAEEGPGGIRFKTPVGQLAQIAVSEGLDLDELLSLGLCEVTVIAGGVEAQCGPIYDYREDPRSQLLEIKCLGLGGWLERVGVEGSGSLTFTAQDESAILWGLVAHTQGQAYGDLQLTDGTTSVGNTRTLDIEPGTTIADVAERMRQELNGATWWIDPDRTVRCALVRGVDRRLSQASVPAVVLTEHDVRVHRGAGWDETATVVLVKGDGVQGWGAASTAELARRGRLLARFDAPNLETVGACEDLAEQHAEDHAAAGEVLELTHFVTARSAVGWRDYGVGDAISLDVEMPSGRLRRDVRVVARTIRPRAYGAAEVDLTVEVIGSDGVLRGARSSHSPPMYRQLWAVRNRVS